MRRIAIVGGGISGLSAAFYFEKRRRQGAAIEYLLFESSSRLGGTLRTEHVDGCVVEAGPDSFLSEKPWAAELCRELGLGDQLIGSNDAQRKTYILVNQRLVSIPEGLMFMVPTRLLPILWSPLFSFSTKLRIVQEWFHPPRPAVADESAATFVERHYGQEMVERLADPLLAGVYGGEAANLSLRAVLPRFAEAEAKFGSLGRAMLASRKKGRAAGAATRGAGALSLFTSLKNGMQQIVDALVANLPAEMLQTNTPVRELRQVEGVWQLISDGQAPQRFHSVIVATPAPVAGRLLESTDARLAAELKQIAYSSSVTVTLGYAKNALQLPPGFGLLVPRTEGKRMLACTFVHNKFHHRAPDDRALLRVFLGGSRDEGILAQSEQEILAIVRRELLEIIGIKSEPLFARVYKWKAAMAQYAVGHLERLQRIEKLRQGLPGLYLVGNGYRGIGVPDCIRSGKEAADQVIGAVTTVATASPSHLVQQ